MYEIILETLALPQYTKIPCENKKCSYILIVLLEVLHWPFETCIERINMADKAWKQF